MTEDEVTMEDFLLEGAAVAAAAVVRNPVLFWFKFWEALWHPID